MSQIPAITLYERHPQGKDGWFPHWRYNADTISQETALRFAAIHAYELGSDIRVVGPNGEEFGIVTVEDGKARRLAEMVEAEPDPMADERLAAIRRRAAFISREPWLKTESSASGRQIRFYAVPGVEWKDDATGAHQDFIAHSNADVGDLLDEVDRLRFELLAANQALFAALDVMPEQMVNQHAEAIRRAVEAVEPAVTTALTPRPRL